jgi:hypothetical protein
MAELVGAVDGFITAWQFPVFTSSDFGPGGRRPATHKPAWPPLQQQGRWEVKAHRYC